jgi:hypothetical protein
MKLIQFCGIWTLSIQSAIEELLVALIRDDDGEGLNVHRNVSCLLSTSPPIDVSSSAMPPKGARPHQPLVSPTLESGASGV